MTVEVQTLGRLAVLADGAEVAAITARPVRAAVVVYLAVERAATRDAVLACIWPDADPALARHTLSQTLYQLRQDLGDAWLDAAGSYLRATAQLVVDAGAFGDAADAGRYSDALSLYRGPFLDGCHLVAAAPFEHWMDRQRGRLARVHHRARRESIDRLVAAGDAGGALTVARGWVELEPLEDEAQQHLIRLLAETGARGEALRQYDDFARTLALEELDPLPDTAALAAEVRAGGVPARPAVVWSAPETPATPMIATRARARRWPVALVGLALLAGAAVVARGTRGRATAASIHSVAVLPFANLTGDSTQNYFVDGVHEALIAELSRVNGMRVISRTSALRYRGSDRSLPEIADALGVDAVVEGSVLRAGDSVRIQASLIAAATDESLATVTYDGALVNVLGLLRDVAARLAGQLTARADTAADSATGAPRQVTPGAYDAYLRARHLLSSVPGSHWRSVPGLYREAIARDSTFGPARAGLAMAYFTLGFFGLEPRDAVWPLAREEAHRALQLDHALAEAHATLGYIALYDDWDWAGADSALRRAINLNPNDALALHGYADLLALRGRAEESLAQVERARLADPLSPLIRGALVGHLYLAGRFDDVIVEVRRFQEHFGPAAAVEFFEAGALWELGRHDDAVAEYRRLWSGQTVLLEAMARGEAEGGARGAMRAAADFLAASAGSDPSDVAAFYARAGDRDAALQWLDRALTERGPAVVHLAINPVFASLRGDPRYAALLRRIGLAPDRRADAPSQAPVR